MWNLFLKTNFVKVKEFGHCQWAVVKDAVNVTFFFLLEFLLMGCVSLLQFVVESINHNMLDMSEENIYILCIIKHFDLSVFLEKKKTGETNWKVLIPQDFRQGFQTLITLVNLNLWLLSFAFSFFPLQTQLI